MSSHLFDETLGALQLALNYRSIRQSTISSNLANANTPGYKAKRLDFEGAFQRALDLEKMRSMTVSSPEHVKSGAGGIYGVLPEAYNDPNGVIKENGNTVDREQEMTKLAQNQVLYSATVKIINKKIALMKYALSGGGN